MPTCETCIRFRLGVGLLDGYVRCGSDNMPRQPEAKDEPLRPVLRSDFKNSFLYWVRRDAAVLLHAHCSDYSERKAAISERTILRALQEQAEATGKPTPRRERECQRCCKPFVPDHPRRVFCPECRADPPAPKARPPRMCRLCGQPFIPEHGRRLTCPACRDAPPAPKPKRARAPRECRQCHQSFVPEHGLQRICIPCKTKPKPPPRPKPRVCRRCGSPFAPQLSFQRLCAECAKTKAWPMWAQQALRAGWKAPEGWKP